MLISAAFCPHPPVLVPELASGSAHELDSLRAACDVAVGRLYEAEPELLVIVGGGSGLGSGLGSGAGTGTAVSGAEFRRTGSFHAYGVDLTVDLGTEDGETPLPLSLLVAGWLPRNRPATPARAAHGVDPDADAESCLALGRRLAGEDVRVAMLVLGDGSACRSVQAPGHFHERAEDFDARVESALASGDSEALAGLDPALASEVLAAGRAPWQVLAGAAEESGGGFAAELLYADAPYGVGYFVASWQRR